MNYPEEISMTEKPGNHGIVLETGRGVSPFPLQSGNEATSTVDPNVDIELEFTPGDLGQAIVPTAGKEALGMKPSPMDMLRGG